jgi:hypothetical protein
MPRVKKPEPLSLSLSPLNKSGKPKDEKGKIGVISRTKGRKMLSIRMRPEMIDLMESIIKRLKKKTRNKYSQSSVIEMALLLASKVEVDELLQAYGETFTL